MTSIRPVTVAPRARAVKAPLTPLQKHVKFFDADGDGKLKVSETRQGLKRLGLGGIEAALSAVVIHLGMAKTWDGFMQVAVERIARGKHDSDTDAYDENGHVNQARVDAIMAYDANRSGSVSASELSTMIEANKESTAGRLASKAEFGMLMKVAADASETENGKSVPAVSREQLQSLYDGTLFYRIAEAREAK